MDVDGYMLGDRVASPPFTLGLAEAMEDVGMMGIGMGGYGVADSLTPEF